MKTRIFLIAIISTIFFSLQVPTAIFAQPTSEFSDVPISHPNYNAIMSLKSRGIINGYPDGTFKPDQSVNRVEALKIIMLGAQVVVPEATGTGGFSDTNADAWYAKYILKAQLIAIIQGYPDGTFKPEQTVNLAENLKLLIKTGQIDLSKMAVNEDPYADVFKNEWYAKYAQYAKDHNLIDSDEQNKIYPSQAMTRAKLAELMFRFSYINDQGIDKFSAPLLQTQETQESYTELSINNFTFTPAEITITPGSKVRWTNQDSTAHTIAEDNSLFESTTLGQNESFTYSFDKEGIYIYHCSIHPYMTGTITVKPASEVPANI